eukprot:5734486-Pleurochrysis_carterae.AAC.1
MICIFDIVSTYPVRAVKTAAMPKLRKPLSIPIFVQHHGFRNDIVASQIHWRNSQLEAAPPLNFQISVNFTHAVICSQSGNAPPQPRLGGRSRQSKYRARDLDAQNRGRSGPGIWTSADLFKYWNAER